MAGKTKVSNMAGGGRNRNYFQNLAKEIGDYVRGADKLGEAKYKAQTYPPEKRPALRAKANALREKQDKNFGQLAGAVFQGRRYNKKGVQIKK